MAVGVTGEPMGNAVGPVAVVQGHEKGFAIALLPRMEEGHVLEVPTNQLDVTPTHVVSV